MLWLNLHKQLWQDFKQACELICVSRSTLPASCFSKSALIFHVMWPELSRRPCRGRYWNILHRVCAKLGHSLRVLILISQKSCVILSVPGHCNNCWEFRNGMEHLQVLHGGWGGQTGNLLWNGKKEITLRCVWMAPLNTFSHEKNKNGSSALDAA